MGLIEKAGLATGYRHHLPRPRENKIITAGVLAGSSTRRNGNGRIFINKDDSEILVDNNSIIGIVEESKTPPRQ